MIYIPEKYKNKEIVHVNKELFDLKGELSDKQAKITLAKYMRANLGIATEMLLGIRLEDFQTAHIKMMFNRNFSLNIWGRSVSKSFTARIFAILYLIFNPGARVLLVGPTFRTAKLMFNEIEKIVTSKEAFLVHDIFVQDNKRMANEMYEWKIPIGGFEGSLRAIPLSGEKIRGLRADVLIVDEFLLIPRDILERVLFPFILSPQDIKDRGKITEIEDKMIADGLMEEKDRTRFVSTSKLVGLSSASYEFEYLYELYNDWVDNIYKKEFEENGAKYFVSRLSYRAAPPHMLDMNAIEEARKGEGQAYFQREYEARFLDDSDSYFSAKKMYDCKVPNGESPTMSLFGDKSQEYILAIDPNFSTSEKSDFFAMAVIQIHEGTNKGTLVHAYGYAGAAGLNGNARYLRYILNNYNIKMIIVDSGGGEQFFNGVNESKWFNNDKLTILDFDSNKSGEDYLEQLKELKLQYNAEKKKYVIRQVFNQGSVREMNEYLQACIDHKRIWFGSKINGNDIVMEKFTNKGFEENFPLIHYFDNQKSTKGSGYGAKMIELVDIQDNMVEQTIKQCSSIVVRSTPQGSQTFDLPQNLKRDSTVNRVRKDNYSALMLGCWGLKIYNEMKEFKGETKKPSTFTPFLI